MPTKVTLAEAEKRLVHRLSGVNNTLDMEGVCNELQLSYSQAKRKVQQLRAKGVLCVCPSCPDGMTGRTRDQIFLNPGYRK